MKQILYFLYVVIINLYLSIQIDAQNTQFIDKLVTKLQLSKEDTNKVNILTTLSKEYRNTNPELALKYAYQGLSLAKQINFKSGIAAAYNRIGTIYLNQGNYPLATSFFQQSVKVSEDDHQRKAMASSYINIGIVNYRQSNYDNSLKYLNKALTIYKQLNDSLSIASCYTNIGMVFHFQAKYEDALVYYFKSLKIQQSFNSQLGMAYCYNNIGCSFKEIGDYAKSIEYLNKSLMLFQELKDSYDVAEVYNSLAELYFAENKINEAIVYYHKALEIAVALKSLDQVQFNYKGLSKSYAKIKDFKKAYQFHLLFKKDFDSVFNTDNTKKITQLELNYEFEKKMKEQELIQNQRETIKKAEIEKQRVFKYHFIIGFLFTSLLVILTLRSYRIIYITNIQLKKQKSEIQTQKDLILLKNEELNQQKEEIIGQKEMMLKVNDELGKKNIQLSKSSSINNETNVSIIVADEKGSMEWVNEDFIKLYGFTLENYLFYYSSLFERAGNKEKIIEQLKKNQPYQYEFESKTKSEDNIFIKSTLIPVMDEQGKLLKVIALDSEVL